MTPSLVSHVKASYGPELEAALERAAAPFGGFGALVAPGERIGVKVNLLRGAPPEQALGLYDSASVQTLIPQPHAPAAFAALTGTSLEPAINYFLQNTATIKPPIAFGDLASLTAPSSTKNNFNGTFSIVTSSRYGTNLGCCSSR